MYQSFFVFNHTATTNIYTLSLHDALPISSGARAPRHHGAPSRGAPGTRVRQIRSRSDHHRLAIRGDRDRKSTRLNSSHLGISYAVFCLKKNTAAGAWHADMETLFHIQMTM